MQKQKGVARIKCSDEFEPALFNPFFATPQTLTLGCNKNSVIVVKLAFYNE